MRIGVLADTHGFFDPRLGAAFAGVEAILHAGDIGSVALHARLNDLAPTYAVRGNNDLALVLELPDVLDIELAGVGIHVVHQLPDARPGPATRVVVFGHSHRQVCEWRDGVLYLNPGAAGRRGFHRLQTAALLEAADGVVAAELLALGSRLTLPRPGVSAG